MRRAGITFLLCLVALGLVPGGAAAASAEPVWAIDAVPYPSAFEAGTVFDSEQDGPAYLVEARNLGGESTSGKFVLSDVLPPGLLPAKGFAPTGAYGPQKGGFSASLKLSCSAAARKVTCEGGAEGGVGPGQAVDVVVPVQVEAGAGAIAGAGGTLLDKATIEGGGAAKVEATTPTPIGSSTSSPFAFIEGPGLFGSTTYADGSEARLAGSHPYQMTVAGMNLTMDRNTPGVDQLLATGGGLREATVELPKGTVINPQAAARCKESQLETELTGREFSCPRASQVGTVALALSIAGGFGEGAAILPLYNMVPPPGYPAELGFEVTGGSYVHLLGGVRSDGSFTLTAASRDVLAKVPIGGVRVTLWGDPSAANHDDQRGECLINPAVSGCSVTPAAQAFVTMPSACGGALVTSARIRSWGGEGDEGSYAAPEAIEGCDALVFEPTIESKATTNQTESPSGLEFDLHQTQHEGAEELASANLKDATVTLPEGMVLNPSAANGREGCSSSQLGATTPTGTMPIRYLEEPAHCPDASKLGTATVRTPLLDHELEGSVYLAKPFDNPFGSLLAIYIVIEDEQTGIIAKLAGKVEAHEGTGRLTTTFQESPELPLEDVKLDLFGGSRAALSTPIACGTHTTTSTLTPWSTPEGADAHPTAAFSTEGSCAASEAAAPKEASFTAGTESPLSGAYSPFILRITRKDGTQHITGIETTLPEGLLGKLAGVSECPASGIARAISREQVEKGKEEIASPSCPASSEVGTVNVTAGSGITPIPVSGHAYLAGPYKGAPLSLVVIVPAVAGPFDLGTVVDRVALNVGEYDARIHAVADPLPTMRDGIPLDVRSIELKLSRSDFTLNPTSCEAMAIEGQASTEAGQSIPLKNSFQVGECARLAFKPALKLSLKGATKRTGHPALTATVTYPSGGANANIARAQVSLPHSEFLDQGNLNNTCTKPVMQAGACPASSVYGRAKAWTPLLEKPLEGNVYLVGGYGYKLPALVAELDGKIRVLLVGKVDTGKNKGIRNTFETVPDAPVEKFVLQMKGGRKYGLLENSEDVCRKEQKARASFTAQNGRILNITPRIANSCKKKRSHKHKPHKKRGKARGPRKKS